MKDTLRKEVSRITGYTFTSTDFRKIFEDLDREGRLSSKQQTQIVGLLLERVADLEGNL